MVDAVEALAALEHDPKHLRKLVNVAIWNVTEYKMSPRHKYGGLRWRTPSAHERAHPPWTGLRHEHVIGRDWLMRLLRATPNAAEEVLWNLPVALVTTEEHALLDNDERWDSDQWGWGRYLRANLSILDTTSEQPVDLRLMQQEARDCYQPMIDAARQLGADL